MKKLMLLFAAMLIGLSAMAQSFAGKTYRCTIEDSGYTGQITLKFTSASRGSFTTSGSMFQKGTLPFTYQVSGDVINIYGKGAGFDYIYIDTDHYYGDDCLYIMDQNSPTDETMVFKRVTSTSKGSGKSSKKRR